MFAGMKLCNQQVLLKDLIVNTVAISDLWTGISSANVRRIVSNSCRGNTKRRQQASFSQVYVRICLFLSLLNLNPKNKMMSRHLPLTQRNRSQSLESAPTKFMLPLDTANCRCHTGQHLSSAATQNAFPHIYFGKAAKWRIDYGQIKSREGERDKHERQIIKTRWPYAAVCYQQKRIAKITLKCARVGALQLF